MVDICANEICKLYYDNYKFFFSKPNVVGIGYGNKFTKKINTFEPCIQVFVEKKISKNCLTKDGLIPPLFNGVKTDVIQTGRFVSGGGSSSKRLVSANQPNDYTGRIRPIQPGWGMSIDFEVYPCNNDVTGTFGYIVTDNEQSTKTFCLLSASGTFADWNVYPEGGDIIQPSYTYDGRAPEDVVAKLLRYSPITFYVVNSEPPLLSEMNVIDAAVATLIVSSPVQLINPFIPPNQVIPSGIGSPQVGMNVSWTGCVGGNKTGPVTSVNVILKAYYESFTHQTRVCWFKDVSLATGNSFKEDTGALIYANTTLNSLGLLFTISTDSTYIAFCDIKAIQDILKVTLIS